MDRIEIRSGTTGELKSFTDKEQVQKWVQTIRHIEFKPDPNQEPRTGFLFYVDLYEGPDQKLRFTPSDVADHYYIYNHDLAQRIRGLFEAKQ